MRMLSLHRRQGAFAYDTVRPESAQQSTTTPEPKMLGQSQLNQLARPMPYRLANTRHSI